MPEKAIDVQRGVEVVGLAWVGVLSTRSQKEWRFTVSIPQKMLHRRRKNFVIEELVLNEAEQTLELTLVCEKSTE